jgi:hypothetical protein
VRVIDGLMTAFSCINSAKLIHQHRDAFSFAGKIMRRKIRLLVDRAFIVFGLFIMCLVVKAGMFGVALLTWG